MSVLSTAIPVAAPVAAGLVAPASFASTAFSGSMLLAIPVAAIAGFLSFASPCILPLVPGYVGYVSGWAATNAVVGAAPVTGVAVPSTAVAGQGATPATGSAVPGAPAGSPAAARRRVVAGVGLFVLGFTLVFVVLGGFFGALGSHVVQWEDTIVRVLGVVVLVMGLAFLGFLPFLQREARLHVTPRTGLWGAPLLGIVFGLGWTPCLGPTLAAVYSLALDQATVVRGAVLAVAYCVGLGVPFLLIAFGLQSSRRMLDFLRRHRVAFLRVGGGMLVVIGLAMITGVWGSWTTTLQGWAAGYGGLV